MSRSPGHQAAPALSFYEWMSVLKLSRSRRWDLATTREHALAGSNAIVQKKISLEKILLGKVDKWVEEGYCALISR